MTRDIHGTERFDPEALKAVMDWWFKAACDCCGPNALEEGLDHELWRDPAFLDRARRFGLEVCHSAQWGLDDLASVDDETEAA